MRSVINALGWVLLGIVLKQLLDPVLGPVVGPILPTIGGLIQSTMTRANEAAFTTAIRYTAAGYREPGDVLLTLVGLAIWGAFVIWALWAWPRPSRPPDAAPPRPQRHVVMTIGFVVVLALAAAFFTYLLVTELTARTTAMQMYKLYERKMAMLAPYISPQEARELGSQWARMHTRADLRAMDERFRALLQQHGLISQ